ncbi:hypothetical protein F5884DRAFT_194553 [Xylogone sp. PMI_703]|nr:hypothetical protein F5884DRAFT_194553 [Xylogone sp. PMI_703]
MSAVASKNLYELLGNTHDEDSDREPDPPVKVVDKTPARTNIKRNNATGEAPPSRAPAPSGRGGRRGGYNGTGNEAAFRDRNAGSAANSARPTDETRSYDRPARGTGTRRGGHPGDRRGGKHIPSGSEKQADRSWGANEGGAELADERAGEQIAQQEEKAEGAEGAAEEPAAEPEPEDHSISYSDYLAQLAEKKLALGAGVPEPRKPNEGSKLDKKWANAKQITNDDDEDFIAGSGGKTKRERERKQKQVVEIDQRFVEQPDRGGRGGFRGGRSRGDGPSRGGRGEYRGRGDGTRGRGRGDFRGGRGGPRGGAGTSINTDDTTAFPSLGSS